MIAPAATAPERVALVVAGGGARGAYEAGALSVLLPHLERAGVRPRTYVGTSAGAVNATLLAAGAHLPAAEQTEQLLAVWRGIGPGDVFRPVALSGPVTATQWAGQLLRLPGAHVTGLVDTAPLRRTAARVVDWERLRANLDGGLAALALVTTSARTGRTVVFVDRSDAAVPRSDDARPIDYVAARTGPGHVLASAAIPVLFPPVHLEGPPRVAGWYVDGGVRLNAPLKPALALGADAVVVVATHPGVYPEDTGPVAAEDGPPDVDDVVVQVLDAALVDRMVEDVHTLGTVNALVEAGARRTRPGRPYAVVPFLFVGPTTRGALGVLAAQAADALSSGLGGALRALRAPDLPLLARLLRGRGDRDGDLLSYLMFDRGFVDSAIALGRADAAAALGSDATVPWRTR